MAARRRMDVLRAQVAPLAADLGSVAEEIDVRCAPGPTVARALPSAVVIAEHAVRTSPVAIAVIDLDGAIVQHNAALCELTGRGEDQLLGRPWLALGHPDDRADEAIRTARLLRGEVREVSLEQRYPRPDGRACWGRLLLTRIDDEHGHACALLAQVEDISDRRAAEDRLADLALLDPLTGVASRTLFLDRAEHALRRSRRSGALVAILTVDLDRFRRVNDALGHGGGDEVLATVAERLVHCVRPHDTVGRFGSDRFAIVCEDLGAPAEALAVGRRLLAAVSRPIAIAGTELVVTASAGVSISARGAAVDRMLRDAERATLTAKRKGRARVELGASGAEETGPAAIDLGLEAELRRALVQSELRVWYQPQFSLPERRLVGLEALVRWEHPERGLLLPGAFLGTAERCGLARDIGTVVLDEACRRTRGWLEAAPDLQVSVNLSSRQLETPGFTAHVAGILRHHRLRPASVCFEVTETQLLDLKGVAARQLAQLQALGTPLALDDFGTGWSSLSHVTDVPVSVLKIDRSFVNEVAVAGTRGAAVVGAVVGLAHSLGLQAIAEGAETEEQVVALGSLGCDGVQGYHLGRPAPAEVIDGLLTLA